MKILIQRVRHAHVAVSGNTIGSIDQGILALIGVEKTDTEATADKLIHKLLNYRIFSDEHGKMNLSVSDIQGGLLLVSQFTLVADTSKGLRPGFSKGATPEQGEQLYQYVVDRCREQNEKVETGKFGADMQITLLNDGPVTFMLEA